MSSKTTWSLVAGAAVLFALIFFLEHPWREARNKPVSRKILPGLDAASVNRVKVQSEKLVLQAECQDQHWKLVNPIAYPADAARVQLLIQTVANMEWQTCLTAEQLNSHPQPEKEFGFDPPQFSLTFQEGKTSRQLLVGTNSAWGDEVYVQLVGGDKIFLVHADLLKVIPVDRDAWRDTRLVDLENMPIETIKVSSGGKNFELQRDDAGLWRINTLQTRADTAKVEELLSQLQSIRSTNFVSEGGADLEPYGLQAPAQTPALELSFLQGTNQLFSLQMGLSPTNQPNKVYVRRQNPANVLLVSKEPLRGWLAAASTFRDRHILSCSPSLIDTIEVQGDEHFTLKQHGTNWQILGQSALPIDAELMSNLLETLTNAEVEVEQSVVVDYSAYGLAKPLLKLSFFGIPPAPDKTNLIAEVAFGASTNQPDKVFERRTDEQSVNTIHPEIFARFPRASWEMLDRQIWNFASSNVVAVTIRQKGSTQKLIRDPDQNWTVAPGSFGMVNSESLEETLRRLGELRAAWWSGRGDTNLERFGFAETDHQISLQVKKDGKLETLDLQFGKQSPYVRPYASVIMGKERVVFEFDTQLYFRGVKADLTIPPAFRNANK